MRNWGPNHGGLGDCLIFPEKASRTRASGRGAAVHIGSLLLSADTLPLLLFTVPCDPELVSGVSVRVCVCVYLKHLELRALDLNTD